VLRGGPIAFTAAVLLVLGLTAAEFTRSRQPAALPGARGNGVAAVLPGRTVAFPPSAHFTAATRFAADGDPASDTALWSVERDGGDVRMSSWRLRGDRIVRGAAHALPGVAAGTVDVGRWSDAHPSVAMTARSIAGGVHVEVRDLKAGAALVRRGDATGLPAPPDEGRFLGFARWSEPLPDLFVIDAGPERGRMQVRAYSGESGFRERLLLTTIPYGGFPLSRWAVDVGAVNSDRADVAIVSRNETTATGRAEVHVATATSTYQSWGRQAPLPMAARDSADRQLLLGRVDHGPVLYAVDVTMRQLLIVTL
jgi:hypothetical protein